LITPTWLYFAGVSGAAKPGMDVCVTGTSALADEATASVADTTAIAASAARMSLLLVK
jgi:hypothetical protein